MLLIELFNDLFERSGSTKTSATAWVILYTDKKLILGKRSPSSNNPNLWNFFGGHIDVGESAVEAACRELKEETGYKIDESKLKEIAKIGSATYFSAKISDPNSIGTTKEVSAVKTFKLTDLPNNLHSKTENFFTNLANLLD